MKFEVLTIKFRHRYDKQRYHCGLLPLAVVIAARSRHVARFDSCLYISPNDSRATATGLHKPWP